MRSINPETGQPYPRRKPVNWRGVRSILAWRQADKRLRDQGFVALNAFAAFPWTNGHPDSWRGPRIVATAHHPDGQNVYVKLEYER
jgi:hypothetical protein